MINGVEGIGVEVSITIRGIAAASSHTKNHA
jgi:hypothetical protein